jgi:hypothetical protein
MAETTTLDYLREPLRMHLGDSDSSRYTDTWLDTALISSVEALQKWWDYKYLLDTNDNAYRNPNHRYLFSEPPVIQDGDNRPIVLMASIIIKSGDLENMAWNLGSWRDAEISYSNIQSGRTKNNSLERDWRELTDILKPPQKRLSGAKKGHLPGYKDSPSEYKN